MADILIKGMVLPNRCFDCPVFDDFCQERCGVTGTLMHGEIDPKRETLPDCPLVPLPEGHGRLIDADTFKADCLAATKEAKPDFVLHKDWLKSCAITLSFCRDIDERPTIVPAEGGTDDGQTDIQK